ncbi:U-box domain-containing protein 45 [Apostasia shenzhenica]|uniref:RING-type E3 ubiquitin transferase n=1 Tax=Apostasia shenzhenica TaxID=1088818 RepID=A0A2I0AGV2_9ASPA|nr:U-box domain-containing protein 45 [Apostasia shenzhenica]
MDSSEIEEKIFVVSDVKLHGGMCKILSFVVSKILEIFPYIEAARPRSKSGIQSLCALHVALDKAKSLLRHCSDCSKLYLAITGDSILVKFEKARCSLRESLRRVEDIVPESIGSQYIDFTVSSQIVEIVGQLEVLVFELDQSEKQIGDDVISLLQKERQGNSSPSCNNELEIFHQAASRLGIMSSRAALIERRALKKLISKARAEDDRRKESIVSYLLHLMRKYSKLFRGEVTDDTDSLGSAPCSLTMSSSMEDTNSSAGIHRVSEKQINKQNGSMFTNLPVPPEELRCPISLQLMYDPVIISSGQTYERACIEKWFSDGHHSCPKTQQQLPHLCLTPNYCVKGLIASWCEQNGFPILDGPPESPDSGVTEVRSSCLLKETEAIPLDTSCSGPFDDHPCQGFYEDELRRYESLLAELHGGSSLRRQCKAAEQIRLLLKDDEEARIYMGASGFVEALVQFLNSAIDEGDVKAQEIGAMALFNLTMNNKKNRETLLSSSIIPLLQKMISNLITQESATALILNLSWLDEAKPIIASGQLIPFLIQPLQSEIPPQSTSCKHDALFALFNLSTLPSNIQPLLDSGIVVSLLSLLIAGEVPPATEKVLAIFINIASVQSGKREMVSSPGLISTIAGVLDAGEPSEQELAVSCLLSLCSGDDHCIDMVLQEGVIPALVSVSVSGSTKGREKAQRLLKLFREQRQRDPPPPPPEEASCIEHGMVNESKPLCKARSRKLGRTLSGMWKNRHFSVYQC